uniref:F-box only protein 4 isoform X2 n=1 Tax=Pristiophorus japonicus TaxID=55135 RepID=UPI00398EFE74
MASHETPENEWSRIEKAIRTSLRHIRDRYVGLNRHLTQDRTPFGGQSEQLEATPLQRLPVEVQLHIVALLSPRDLCRLGSTNCYWNAMVRDPLLWRYFLLRDLPHWNSVDHLSLPDATLLSKSLTDSAEHDYMAAYLKSSPEGRKHWKLSHPYSPVTSFLHFLVSRAEPRFAMFGPGLEQLDSSLVRKMISSPSLRLVASLPQRQIDGRKERAREWRRAQPLISSLCRKELLIWNQRVHRGRGHVTASFLRSRTFAGRWMASSTWQMLKPGEATPTCERTPLQGVRIKEQTATSARWLQGGRVGDVIKTQAAVWSVGRNIDGAQSTRDKRSCLRFRL